LTLHPERSEIKLALNHRTGLVDFHAHFVTDRYAGAAQSAGVAHPDAMPGWPKWNLAEHEQLMADTGVRRAVLSISSPGVYFGDQDAAVSLSRDVNEYAAAACREKPDKFSFFASVPLPAVEAAVDEAAYALDTLGAIGLALLSNTAGLYLGDSALNPLWELLDRRRAIAFVHPTSPPNAADVDLGLPRPMLEFMFDTTRTVTQMMFTGVIDRYPGVRFVIPHCGAALPILADRIEWIRLMSPQLLGRAAGPSSTRDQLRRLWFDLAGTPLPVQAAAITRAVGSDRILYGSDCCWTPAPAVAKHADDLDSHAQEVLGGDWRAVTTANAERLLASSNSAAAVD
jgi:predicted TIM-barrel fold metal-dependent hydrolase